MAHNTTISVVEKLDDTEGHSTDDIRSIYNSSKDSLSPTIIQQSDEKCDSELSEDETLIDKDSTAENVPDSSFDIIRVTRADLTKFPNYDPENVPNTLKATEFFIEKFIQSKRSKGMKRKHDNAQSCSEVQKQTKTPLEKLQLNSEISGILGASIDNFMLLIYHSKTSTTCKGPRFTKELVTASDGKKIVTVKPASSLILFFYRILERDTKPEIFVITFGQFWRIAKEIACVSYPVKFTKSLLENKTLHQKLVHIDGGPVLSTEQYARGGEKLDPDETDIGDTVVQKSTRLTKDGTSLTEQGPLKSGSRIYVSTTNTAFRLKLNIKDINELFKHISEEIQNCKIEFLDKLEKVEEKQLRIQLNEQLINRLKQLTETDDNGKYLCADKWLQHEETGKWNEKTELKLLARDKQLKSWRDERLTFRQVFTVLKKYKISVEDCFKEDCLKTVRIKWDKCDYALNQFLVDFINFKGTFYRYLFGEWFTVTNEYISDKEKEFKDFLNDSFLPASKDFPILPWIYKSKQPAQSASTTPRKDKRQADSGLEFTQSSEQGESQAASFSVSTSSSLAYNEVIDTVKLGKICTKMKNEEEEDTKGYERFRTKAFKTGNRYKIIHHPVKVDFDTMLKNKNQNGSTNMPTDYTSKQIAAEYSVCKRTKVSAVSYYIPQVDKAEKTVLENLLFLRMNTPITEGEYNDLHVLLMRLLKIYKDDRFIIIPGDEIFVQRKNIELYDILISDEKENITYIIHVKAGFGVTTRDVCSQLRLSAQCIRDSNVSKSSILEQYWNNNAFFNTSKEGYKGEVAEILKDIGKEKFLNLFTDEKRRLVFVYACRDSRKTSLHQEVEMQTDSKSSAEKAVKNALLERQVPSETITQMIKQLKKKLILNDRGNITNEYMFNKKCCIKDAIQEIDSRGSKENAIKAIEKVFKERLSDSDSYIAKWELLNLKHQFAKYVIGARKLELRICQVPMSLYLEKNTGSMEESEASSNETNSDDLSEEPDDGDNRSDVHDHPQRMITEKNTGSMEESEASSNETDSDDLSEEPDDGDNRSDVHDHPQRMITEKNTGSMEESEASSNETDSDDLSEEPDDGDNRSDVHDNPQRMIAEKNTGSMEESEASSNETDSDDLSEEPDDGDNRSDVHDHPQRMITSPTEVC